MLRRQFSLRLGVSAINQINFGIDYSLPFLHRLRLIVGLSPRSMRLELDRVSCHLDALSVIGGALARARAPRAQPIGGSSTAG